MKEKMCDAQITFGQFKDTEGKYRYDIVFFFNDSEDSFTEGGGLEDRYNYFVSNSSFFTKKEAAIYGDIVLSFIETYITVAKDVISAAVLLCGLTTKTICPQTIKNAVEKTHLQNPDGGKASTFLLNKSNEVSKNLEFIDFNINKSNKKLN